MKRRSLTHIKSDATKPQGKSAYAKKVNSGNQLYGPGCCAHTLTQERMHSIRKAHNTLNRGMP